MKWLSFRYRGNNAGFTLTETVLAVGIASVVIVALFGLIAVGLRLNKRSQDLIESSEAATFLVSILRAEAATGGRAIGSGELPVPLLDDLAEGASVTGKYTANSSGLEATGPTDAAFEIQYFLSKPDKALARVHFVICQPVGAPAGMQDQFEIGTSLPVK